MKLNLIIITILQEKERIDRMLKKYQEELEKLPKGTLSEKKAGQSTYFYLKYRDGKKVISQYIPKKDVEDVRKQVADLFTLYRVWEYVYSCFEALHTTGANYIVEDIDLYIEARKPAMA